ncbi:MAG: hypothetical protein JXB62_09655, partial [Pirellulales bacterium]|nr:hypothetical protein [Pirellulales bacterium]
MKTLRPPLDLCAAITHWSDIEAVASDGDSQTTAPPRRLRRFAMTAYTGGEMDLPGWNHPVVVDLAGLSIASQSRPILKDHNRGLIVGHTDRIEPTDHSLKVTGVISGAGAVAQEVIASSENGFPWRASIGARARQMVLVPAGRQVSANGRTFTGPIYVARKAVLGEISFVALAADEQTTARVAAGAAGADNPDANVSEVFDMDFEAWVGQQGFVLAELNENQTACMRAMFESSQQQPPQSNESPPAGEDTVSDHQPDLIARYRADFAAELKRIEAIEKLCGTDQRPIAAEAIAEGWDLPKTELAVLRASRPK